MQCALQKAAQQYGTLIVFILCMKYQINQQVWLLDATQLPTCSVRVKKYDEDSKMYMVTYLYPDNEQTETALVPSRRLVMLPELLNQLQECA